MIGQDCGLFFDTTFLQETGLAKCKHDFDGITTSECMPKPLFKENLHPIL